MPRLGMSKRVSLFFLLLLIFASVSQGAVTPSLELSPQSLLELESQMIQLEEKLIRSLGSARSARKRRRMVGELRTLHKKQIQLTQKRTAELEQTLERLKKRKSHLDNRVGKFQARIYQSLRKIRTSLSRVPEALPLPKHERIEAPRRRILSRLVDLGLKEIEELRIDLSELSELRAKIEEESRQLEVVAARLEEDRTLAQLGGKLQEGVLQRDFQKRLNRLKKFHSLKIAERQVFHHIRRFNARVELEELAQEEREVAREVLSGRFTAREGQLKLPTLGKVVGAFGKSFDEELGVVVHRKGIQIRTEVGAQVEAIAPAKLVYAGKIPGRGEVVILDHGAGYYSLTAHLQKLTVRKGDWVQEGQVLGSALDKPLYFEIRQRNVAINPLKWVSR